MHILPLVFLVDSWKSILSFLHSPSAQNCQALNRARLWCLLLILTCANCDQLIPFPFSAKSTFHHFTRWTFRFLSFYWEVIAPSRQNPLTKLYIKVASQEEFCCAKQRLFGFCHESQTSRIIPTTIPPLRFTVKSRREEDLLLPLLLLYIYTHTDTFTLTHTNRKHTIQWYNELTGQDKSVLPPNEHRQYLQLTYQARRRRSTRLSRRRSPIYLWETLFITAAAGWPVGDGAFIIHPPSPFNSSLHSHSKNP